LGLRCRRIEYPVTPVPSSVSQQFDHSRNLFRPNVIPAMKFLVACAIASFFLNGANAASSSASAQESWRSEAPMHYARAAHAVVGDGKSLYALAGTGAGGAPVLVFERFDGRTWRDEGSIPRPGLNAPAAVALNGKIYLIGGFY